MLSCNCTLDGTPACKQCPNYSAVFGKPYEPPWPFLWWGNIPYKKVIEEYDKDGKLIKRTVEHHDPEAL